MATRTLMVKGQSVWVGWPYCNEAYVIGVADRSRRQWLDKRGEVASGDMHPDEWKQILATSKEALLMKQARGR